MRSWRYILTDDYTFLVPAFSGLVDEIYEHQWFSITPHGEFTVKAGYAWDGATGWPDGPIMANPPIGFQVEFSRAEDAIRVLTRGTASHDALYQFMELIAEVVGMKPSELRLIADVLLGVCARADGAPDWLLVQVGVRLVGGIYHSGRKLLRRLFRRSKSKGAKESQ